MSPFLVTCGLFVSGELNKTKRVTSLLSLVVSLQDRTSALTIHELTSCLKLVLFFTQVGVRDILAREGGSVSQCFLSPLPASAPHFPVLTPRGEVRLGSDDPPSLPSWEPATSRRDSGPYRGPPLTAQHRLPGTAEGQADWRSRETFLNKPSAG